MMMGSVVMLVQLCAVVMSVRCQSVERGIGGESDERDVSASSCKLGSVEW